MNKATHGKHASPGEFVLRSPRGKSIVLVSAELVTSTLVFGLAARIETAAIGLLPHFLQLEHHRSPSHLSLHL